MKKFTIKLLLFFILPLPVFYSLQFIADSGLRKSNSYYFNNWNEIYSGQINADLVITGSSRAYRQFSPRILDEQLNTNSYNLGLDGWKPSLQHLRLKVYLQHNRIPKYIIINLDNWSFYPQENIINPQQLLPYLDDPLIKDVYLQQYNIAQLYYPLLKYQENLDSFALGCKLYFGLEPKEQRTVYKGYEGREINSFERPNGDIYFVKHQDKEISSQSIREFEEYLAFCRNNGIKAILVYSPEFEQDPQFIARRQQVIKIYQNFAEEFDMPFLDYSNHPVNFDKEYFYDSQHLDRKGAELFSYTLAQDLKAINFIK